jgi:hypothetical protein
MARSWLQATERDNTKRREQFICCECNSCGSRCAPRYHSGPAPCFRLPSIFGCWTRRSSTVTRQQRRLRVGRKVGLAPIVIDPQRLFSTGCPTGADRTTRCCASSASSSRKPSSPRCASARGRCTAPLASEPQRKSTTSRLVHPERPSPRCGQLPGPHAERHSHHQTTDHPTASLRS